MSQTAPSKAELAVLKHLWSAGPQSAREVHDAVAAAQDWSYSTTRTLLTRMTDKGLVARADVHGLSVFSASAEKVSLLGRMIRDFTSSVLELEGPLAATAFANSRLFTEEEAAALTRMLEADDEADEAETRS